jgi:hypothetical protein
MLSIHDEDLDGIVEKLVRLKRFLNEKDNVIKTIQLFQKRVFRMDFL